VVVVDVDSASSDGGGGYVIGEEVAKRKMISQKSSGGMPLVGRFGRRLGRGGDDGDGIYRHYGIFCFVHEILPRRL
jgi:hypothetical protein